MPGEKNSRYFFVLYNNGETVYFSRNPKGEIHCIKFIKSDGTIAISKAANELLFAENQFYLKNSAGEIIFSLEDYNRIKNNQQVYPSLGEDKSPSIIMLYIDEDLRKTLIKNKVITFDEQSTTIIGLLTEQEKQEQLQSNGFSRTRKPNNR